MHKACLLLLPAFVFAARSTQISLINAHKFLSPSTAFLHVVVPGVAFVFN